VSYDFSYDENGDEVSIYYLSSAATNEYFPTGSYQSIWSARLRVGRFPKRYDYFDKEGRLLTLDDHKSLNRLKKGKLGETAEQAVKRLKRVITILKNNQHLAMESLDEIDNRYLLFCQSKITENELQTQEQKLGVKLPASY